MKCPCCDGIGKPCFIAGPYRMIRCENCSAAYVYPQPTAEELSTFYEKYHLSDAEGGYYDAIENRMQADFPAKLRIVRAHRPCVKLLDVGCGKGFFVRACLDEGIDAEGLDLSSSGVDYCRNILDAPAQCGRIEDGLLAADEYDAVTLWATIEHLPNPLETLQAIHRVLRPGGHLHLDTGIGADWLDRWLPGRVQWYDPPQHLFVFSGRSLEILLQKAGFVVVRRDLCFERSIGRLITRRIRSMVAVAALRAAFSVAQLRCGEPVSLRIPIGNLQSWTAVKIS